MGDKLLIIFVKNPVSGKVKTRLAAEIGDMKALAVYNFLLKYTHEITKGLPMDKAVYYSDFIDKNDLWENHFYQKFLQIETNLGERMEHAFDSGFSRGYKKIVIIGSDCFQLTQKHLETAFEVLESKQVAIGPAEDGGYYLLGMNTYYPKLFHNKNWSTASVFEDTLNDIKDLNLRYSLLDKLNDVDEKKDLGSLLRFAL